MLLMLSAEGSTRLIAKYAKKNRNQAFVLVTDLSVNIIQLCFFVTWTVRELVCTYFVLCKFESQIFC